MMNRHTPHPAPCDTCEPRAYTRNNYFTGKLLVERDFTDEQTYVRDKIKNHHKHLHGTGVVCGLELTAHPNPACRDHLVVLNPGSAIDCCGNDILVAAPETVDLTQAPAIAALIADDDGAAHTVQVRLCYRECPTEEVPVLFDECGCDDTQCAPNRILESYDLEVVIDPDFPTFPPGQPGLDWSGTLAIARAAHLVVDAVRGRLYVATDAEAGTIYEVDAATHAVLASAPAG
ncbi:MAG: hypothetical protein AAFU86_14555, partial [Pseudomonadota bacterium]